MSAAKGPGPARKKQRVVHPFSNDEAKAASEALEQVRLKMAQAQDSTGIDNGTQKELDPLTPLLEECITTK